jgi:S1-C subfamily serine protease
MNAIEDYLQTDASINPGNSGGPICNLDGQVLGINTMIVGRGSGIGFAVPSNMARRVADQILKTGHVERAWIGVGAQDLTPELAAAMKLDPRAGALVNSVGDGSPAQKSSIKPGDVIAAVGGKPVHDSHELVREVLTIDVGKVVSLEVIRDGKHYASNVTLTARPEAPVPALPVQQQGVPQPGLGLAIRDLTAQQAQMLGLPAKVLAAVSSVAPGSSADRAGLKIGDVILEVDGVADPTAAQVQEAAADGLLVLRLRRGQSSFYAAIKKQ